MVASATTSSCEKHATSSVSMVSIRFWPRIWASRERSFLPLGGTRSEMNGWGLLLNVRSTHAIRVCGGFEVPSLECYHNFPTIPQLLYKFVFLIFPSRWRGWSTSRIITGLLAYQMMVIAVSVSAGIVRLCESICMVVSYRCSRIRSDSLYVRGSFLVTPLDYKTR